MTNINESKILEKKAELNRLIDSFEKEKERLNNEIYSLSGGISNDESEYSNDDSVDEFFRIMEDIPENEIVDDMDFDALIDAYASNSKELEDGFRVASDLDETVVHESNSKELESGFRVASDLDETVVHESNSKEFESGFKIAGDFDDNKNVKKVVSSREMVYTNSQLKGDLLNNFYRANSHDLEPEMENDIKVSNQHFTSFERENPGLDAEANKVYRSLLEELAAKIEQDTYLEDTNQRSRR